ncbi:hypothetical protein OIU79_006401, partial [Salix purpurea]
MVSHHPPHHLHPSHLYPTSFSLVGPQPSQQTTGSKSEASSSSSARPTGRTRYSVPISS